MAVNNSSALLVSSDFLLRVELNRYMARINFIILFVQAFITLSGLLGNLLALLVINRKSLKNTSSSVFITYMALFDSAVLLVHAANLVRPRHSLFLHCSLTYFTDLFTFCANWILVIITLERCVAVYSPFLAKRCCTVISARCSIYILLISSLLFFSSTFPVIYRSNESSRHPKCVIREHAGLILRIYQPILFYAIPDILLLSNLFTVGALCRRRRRPSFIDIGSKTGMRVNDIHSSRKQRQLTIMLVTVSLSFYLFTTPAMIGYIAEYFPPQHRHVNKLKRAILLSQITVVLLQLNNATNFVFYCLAGQRFRRATIHALHEYSDRFKYIYHRYLLCERRYIKPTRSSLYQHRRNTTFIVNNSYSPTHERNRNRTSTI